jgi:hypothetical protein
MVVVSLVREGINKHRARELADHFAAQPEPMPMRMPKVGDKVICLEDESIGEVVSLTAGGSPDIAFDDGSRGTYRVSEFAELFGYVTAAQRPWQGLTDEEVQFYIKKHSKLFNAGYDKVTETNLIAEEFDSTGFYKEVSTVLKERNT